MHIVYLSLGSNLGDRKKNLENVINLIAERIGNLSAISSIYETEPWGFKSENSFLNMVVKLETQLSPLQLLADTKKIEIEMGRKEKNTKEYKDRIIDIDIILYDDLILKSKELTLPHPLFHEREFVLSPLLEIAPKLIHPLFLTPIKSFNDLNNE